MPPPSPPSSSSRWPGSTGILPPPKGYLKKLREITAQHGILLIFDEVITGFGRLGHCFASERYDVTPDMITFAKGVTNAAVPMAGVMASKKIYDAFMTGPEHMVELFHGYTYSGHPLAAAAGLATLDVYKDEGLFERAKKLEPVFAEAMMSLKGEPNVEDIRTVGLLAGIDLAPMSGKPGLRGYEATERMYHDLNIYVRVAMDTLVASPPLIATESDIGEIRDGHRQGAEGGGVSANPSSRTTRQRRSGAHYRYGANCLRLLPGSCFGAAPRRAAPSASAATRRGGRSSCRHRRRTRRAGRYWRR